MTDASHHGWQQRYAMLRMVLCHREASPFGEAITGSHGAGMALFVFGIGLGLCIVAALITRRTVRVCRTWTRTTANIVNVGERWSEGVGGSDGGGMERWVEVCFLDHAGAERTAKRFVLTRHAATRYVRGQRIGIFSNPACPSEIRIDSVSEHWFLPVLLGSMGVGFVAFGIHIWGMR